MSKLCRGATGVVACLHQQGVGHTLGLGHLQNPAKTGQKHGRKRGSDHFYHTIKREQETRAWDPCQHEEELETKPTQKESPRSELRSRRYDRNGAEGLDLEGNTLSVFRRRILGYFGRKCAFQQRRRTLACKWAKYAFKLGKCISGKRGKKYAFPMGKAHFQICATTRIWLVARLSAAGLTSTWGPPGRSLSSPLSSLVSLLCPP